MHRGSDWLCELSLDETLDRAQMCLEDAEAASTLGYRLARMHEATALLAHALRLRLDDPLSGH